MLAISNRLKRQRFGIYQCRLCYSVYVQCPPYSLSLPPHRHLDQPSPLIDHVPHSLSRSHVCEHLLNRGDDVVLVDEVNDYYDVRIKRGNLRRLRAGWGEDRLRIYEVRLRHM